MWIRIRKITSLFFFFKKEKKKSSVKTWKYGIIKNLYSFGLRGGLPVFVEIFLIINEIFFFNIRVGCTFPIPTSKRWVFFRVASCVLFLLPVKINSINQCLKPSVYCSSYMDDFQICFRSSNMSIIINSSGFRLSETSARIGSPFISTAISRQVTNFSC